LRGFFDTLPQILHIPANRNRKIFYDGIQNTQIVQTVYRKTGGTAAGNRGTQKHEKVICHCSAKYCLKTKKTPHKAVRRALCGVFLKVCSLCCNAVIP